ncbi:putative lipoprotein [Corallococcus coralloides]|uniref:Putative lipoprotein n=1 Tax=Corallococcus coralloides TaxID=184914 RepID=A0A410S2I9_CORCK|nr:lamin tail domain-containing protein [Corallococcus coralloides]QAT88435.1 putative lipoprotein [Corallococcus coralloides]
MPSRSFRALSSLVVLTSLFALVACGSNEPDPSAGPALPQVTLQAATVGAAYEKVLTATGGTAPLTYSVDQVPPGFSFYGDSGRLVGPATTAGEWSMTVVVRDAKGAQHTRGYALRVWPAPVITTASPLPSTKEGSLYTFTFSVTGGTPPLTWSKKHGAIPDGLELTEDGVLTGTPQGPALYEFTLRVEDANGAQAEAVIQLPLTTSTGELPDGGPVTDGGTKPDGGTDGGTQPAAVPLKVGNWNIEWFGSTAEGPTDEAMQLANATAVIADAGPDVLGVAEIVGTDAFNSLTANLNGYSGLLAGDGWYGPTAQKVGLLYKTSAVELVSSNVVLTDCAMDFAYRPPLRVDLKVLRGSSPVDLTVMVLHMKAYADSDSYLRRQGAAACLKDYLDTNLPTQNVMVLGDWNDDVDASIYTPYESPFLNLVNDAVRYKFLTQPLSESGASSTTSNSQFIDHQLVTNELAKYYVAPTKVLKPSIVSYKDTTSDHYPIFSEFNFGSAAQSGSVRVTEPNGGETLNAGQTFDITWTSSNVSQVNITYTLDGTVWRPVASGLTASTGRYVWTVPSESSTAVRVRVADAARADVADVSDGAFTLTRPTQQVFINEYLAQPLPGPTGTPDYDQQFVEIYNAGPGSVDLSGWGIHDAKSYSGVDPARHTFVSGTVLPAGRAYVVYSGSTALPAGAQYATYSNGGAGLRFDRGVNQNGAGDIVYLVRADGTVQDSHSYQTSSMPVEPGYSFNRSPDLSPTGTWVQGYSLYYYASTPGKKANNTAF